MIDLKTADHFGLGARAGGRLAARPVVKAEESFFPLAGIVRSAMLSSVMENWPLQPASPASGGRATELGRHRARSTGPHVPTPNPAGARRGGAVA
jgi:hypothetical protein